MTDTGQLQKVTKNRKEKDSPVENQTIDHPHIVGALAKSIVALDIKTPFAVRFVESDAIYCFVRKGHEEKDAEELTASVLEQGGKPYLVVINGGTPDERHVTDLTVGKDKEPFHIIGIGKPDVAGETTATESDIESGKEDAP